MQKKLIALAVAGLVSAPVFAQSNIQIYGVADAYFKGGKFMGENTMGVDSGGLAGSRIGFRGEEDLGSGLKAVFVLEQGINIGTGKSQGMTPVDSSANSGDQTFTRQAYVGLKGNFGQVALGRQYAPGYYTAEYDALLNAGVSPMGLLSSFAHMSISNSGWARWNNAVTYTGTFQSVSLSAIYSAGNRESDSGRNLTVHGINVGRVGYSDDDKYGLSLKYDNGPLKVGAIYQAVKYGKDNLVNKTQHEWLIGASYNFGMATLAGSYQQANSVEGINDLDIKLWQVGVIVPVGVGNIHVAYAQAKIDNGNPFTDAFGDGSNQKPKAFTVAYTHGFSKRTTGYLGFAYVDYDDLNWAQAGALGYSEDGHNGLSGLMSSGKTETIDKTKLFFVGMNHKF